MNRPKSDDKVLNEYIDHIEKQLKNYTAETAFVKTYFTLRKQHDSLSKTFAEVNMTSDSISDKDDKLFNNYLTWVKTVDIVTESLEKLEHKINPATIKKVDKFINDSEGSWEKVQKLLNNG